MRTQVERSDAAWWVRVLAPGALVALVLFVAAFGVGPLARAATVQGEGGGPIVRCEPSAPVGSVIEQMEVDLYVQDVEELYGADLRLTFDTSMTEVVDADPGTAGVQIEVLRSFLNVSYPALRDIASNLDGTIWYAASQQNPSEPVSGSGPLARITFQPLAMGTFTMTFTQTELARLDGSFIPHSVIHCPITFAFPTPTATNTPTETATSTPTETATSTPPATVTSTATLAATGTATVAATATATATSTATLAATGTATVAATATATATTSPDSHAIYLPLIMQPGAPFAVYLPLIIQD